MFDEIAYDAFEFLYYRNMYNPAGDSEMVDETWKLRTSGSILDFGDISNKSNHKCDGVQINALEPISMANGQENLKKESTKYSKRQAYPPRTLATFPAERKITTNKGKEIYKSGAHIGKFTAENIKGAGNSTEESISSNNSAPVIKNPPITDNFKHSLCRGNASPIVSGVTINKPLIKELDNQGALVNSTEITDVRNESVKHKTQADSDLATAKLLNEVVQDFNARKDNQHLSYGRSNAKREKEKEKTKLKEITIIKSTPDRHEMYQNHDIKTLRDSIAYFDLSSQLQKLDMSLEHVRRNEKIKEDHEECFKQTDKEIQKLSFKYHPDRVKNRGGTEKEIKIAQQLQTALNSTRTALKLLNSAFMEDIGTDHKFEFYTTLNIDSLCNEDEMKCRIYEVIFKIGVISRIKQQNIISEIRKFLIESKCCVRSYLHNVERFEEHRDLALFRLKCCIKGFKKLCAELKDVKEQCQSEENGENMYYLIQKMERESQRDLKLLKSLKKIAKASLIGKYQFFSPTEPMDPYFILPLVSYVNVILMCNVMVRNASIFDVRNNLDPESVPYFRHDLSYLFHPYYLASYCSGNKYHEPTVFRIMDKWKFIEQGLKVEISKKEIEVEFKKIIEQNHVFLEYKFKIENYNETMPTNLLMLDLKKCMKMMTEFEEKEQELNKGIRKLEKKTENMDEKYLKFHKMMEAAEEMNQRVHERLQQNKKVSEKVSNALSHVYK